MMVLKRRCYHVRLHSLCGNKLQVIGFLATTRQFPISHTPIWPMDPIRSLVVAAIPRRTVSWTREHRVAELAEVRDWLG